MALRFLRSLTRGYHTKVTKPSEPNAPAPSWYSHKTSKELIALEQQYAAHNYHPLPVVFAQAQGVHVWDPQGGHYYDFLSAYSAVNQGHNHPKIVESLIWQLQRCSLSSRAFHNDIFPLFAKHIHEQFGYDMVLPANGGVEGVEGAFKLARKWACKKKGLKENEAITVSCRNSFHGRTLTAISMSTDPEARNHYGPFVPGVVQVPFNDVPSLRQLFEKQGHKINAFIVEPIQGEAGVIVPEQGYLRGCAELCKKHNVLLIADEIQTGLGRTGKMLASEWDKVRPDIVILGKAISGGLLPVSAILADKDIMLTIQPGEHGSTYGGNPLASAVGIAALKVLVDEKLSERSLVMGERFREGLQRQLSGLSFVKEIRGKGLFNALEVHKDSPITAWDICMRLQENGVLAKPTHNTIIRFSPPLVITGQQLDECIEIISQVIKKADKK